MRKLFFAVIIFSFRVLSAQDSTGNVNYLEVKKHFNPFLYNYTSPTLNNSFNTVLRDSIPNRLIVDFDYAANSNSVPAQVGYDFLFGGDISDALKNRIDNRIGKRLKFEDNLRTGITYQRYLKKFDGTIFFSYNHRQIRDISAGKDAYELLFYGNSRFEGDTANLSHIRFQNFIFNQYTAGIKKAVDYGDFQMQFGVSLSFLQVIQNQDIRTNNASIYTAPDGEYLDVHYDLTYNTAKEGATHFEQLNGFGVTGDFNISIAKDDKWKLAFDMSDLGSLSFNRDPTNYTGTNTVHFQGIALPDLTSFSSQTFDTLKIDSTLKSNLPQRTHNAYSVSLPFTASLIFSKPLLHDRLVLNVGLQYRNIKGYYAYAFFKTNYFIRPDLVISGTIAAGGYSLCNIGFEIAKAWKHFDFALGSGNIVGLILPTYYAGAAAYIRVGASF